MKRLFASREVLYPADRDQRRYYLLDAARGAAAFMILFFHYQDFFMDPNVAVAAGQAVAEPRPDYLQLTPLNGLFYPLYRYGGFAVALFWMISGFVFSSVYLGTRSTTREFAVNRFARLYPLHVLTLCIVAVLQLFAVSKFGHTLFYPVNDLYHFTLHLFFASNWGLEGSAIYTFNGPIWSVSVEVLIYALFWLTRRWLTVGGIAVPVVLSLLGGGLSLLLGNSFIASCCYYFFLGSCLSGVYAAYGRTPRFIIVPALIAVPIAVAIFAAFRIPILAYFVLSVSFSSLILLLVVAERVVAPRWHNILSMIGDNTYGMYLLHIPVQLALFLCLGHIFDLSQLAQSPWFLFFYLGLVVVLARATFVYFERPMRKRLRRLGHLSRERDRPKITAP
jgi:peptidoglycan/LPS O-acetylase OafA/YrhL